MSGRPDGPHPPSAGSNIANVVVGLPVPRIFSYAVPRDLDGRLSPGQRVRVPFRGRGRAGVVVELTRADASGLETVDAVLDPVPALTGPLLDLTRWAAEETVSAWGEAVARALPPAGRGGTAPTRLPELRSYPPERPVVAYGPGRRHLIEAAAERALGLGGGVLLLTPEIESARTWADRLGRRLGAPASLVTSAEGPRRRWEAWWTFRRGAARVAVGTRVAAFLPVNPLALTVVVDEEDPAHKAPDVPRWHTRELAIRRTRIEGGACLLASGAPSLESWARVRTGEMAAEEAKGDGWPAVHRVDLRAVGTAECLSPALREATREALAAGGSVCLLLNRLGYGRGLSCAECGAVRRCATCRIALTYHRDARTMECRLCGIRSAARSVCARCRGRRLSPLAWGTERVEAEAREAFGGVHVVRYDGAVSRPCAAAAREAFRTGEARVLVGTQMALRLLEERPVAVAALVLVDTTLNLPDFRAAERTFQLAWSLGERVESGGNLWLQSFYPEHAALGAVASGTREPFYEREWAERQELGFPPARRMARLVVEGRDAMHVGQDLAARCRATGLSVLGPAALPGARVQVVLQGGAELPRALRDALEPLRGRRRLGSVRLVVDVDPVEPP